MTLRFPPFLLRLRTCAHGLAPDGQRLFNAINGLQPTWKDPFRADGFWGLQLPAPPFSVSPLLQLLQLSYILFRPSPESSATVNRDGDARSYLLRCQPTMERDPVNSDSLCSLLGRAGHNAITYSIFNEQV